MRLYTLRGIINDILNIIRGSRVSNSERISQRQIEAWVNEYRSKLIKQDLDKNKRPNPDYVQVIDNIEVIPYDLKTEEIDTEFFVFRSKYRIPKSIDLNHKSGILFISNLYGDEIQLITENRANWQRFRRYTSSDKVCYLRDGYLYVHNNKLLKYITISGIFEQPLEAINFNDANKGLRLQTQDIVYPIPANMIPILKQMILERELNILMSVPTDNKNDSAHTLSGNVEGGQPSKQ